MASSVLQQTLRSLCKDVWCYAVFWKLKQQSRKVLTWEDAFYEQSKTQDSTKSHLDPAAGNALMSSAELFNAKDPIGLSVSKMSYHVYSVGEGIIGRVAFTNKHQWVFSSSDKVTATNDGLNSKRNMRTQPDKYPAGWDHQFAAGIKTIAVIAVPQGVLQLGSMQTVLEDLKLVGHVKALFGTLQNVPGAFLSDLMTEVQNGGVHTLYPMSAPTSQLHQTHSSQIGVTNAALIGAPSLTVAINGVGTFGSAMHHSGVGRLPVLLSPHLQQHPLQVLQGTAIQQLPMLYKPGGNFSQPSISSVNNTNAWSQPVGMGVMRAASQTGIMNKPTLSNGHSIQTGIIDKLSLSNSQSMRAMAPPQSGIISKLSLSCGQTIKDIVPPQTGAISSSHPMKASSPTQMGTDSSGHMVKTGEPTQGGFISKFSLSSGYSFTATTPVTDNGTLMHRVSGTTTKCPSLAMPAARIAINMNSSMIATPSVKVSTYRCAVGDLQVSDNDSAGDSKIVSPVMCSQHVVGLPSMNVPQMLSERSCIEIPEQICGRPPVDSLLMRNSKAAADILNNRNSVRNISPDKKEISGDGQSDLLLGRQQCTIDDERLIDIQKQRSSTVSSLNHISPESLDQMFLAKVPDVRYGLLSSERMLHHSNRQWDAQSNLLLGRQQCTIDAQCFTNMKKQKSATGLPINRISPESLDQMFSAKIPGISCGLLSSERMQHHTKHNHQLTPDNLRAMDCQYSLEFQGITEHYENDCSKPMITSGQSSLKVRKSSETGFLESSSQFDSDGNHKLHNFLMQKSAVGDAPNVSSKIATSASINLPENLKSSCDTTVDANVFKFPHEVLQPCSELPGEMDKSERNDLKDSSIVIRGLDEAFFSEDFVEDWHSMKIHARGVDSGVNTDVWGAAACTQNTFSLELDDFDEFLASLTKEKEKNDFNSDQGTDSTRMLSKKTSENSLQARIFSAGGKSDFTNNLDCSHSLQVEKNDFNSDQGTDSTCVLSKKTSENSLQDRSLSAGGKRNFTNNLDCSHSPKKKLKCETYLPMHVDDSKVTGNLPSMKEAILCKKMCNFEDQVQIDLTSELQTAQVTSQSINAQPLDYQKTEIQHMKASKRKKKRGHSSNEVIVEQKGRQKIQKSLGELRKVIPDGENHNIDTLLEKTGKYINLLQMALQESVEQVQNHLPKKADGGSGDVQLGSDGTLIDASWVLELQQEGSSCPIIVENLAQPRQMLIEVVCERPGMLVDIEKSFQKLGLITIKSVMETRNEKTWARFQVEGLHDIHRLQVLWSLMQLLEPSS